MRFNLRNGARACWLGGLVCTTLVGGCQSPHIANALSTNTSANDSHAITEYWYQLADRPVVTNDEVFHALLLYLNGSDPCRDYPARVAELKSRQMLPAAFRDAADQALTRGTLAVALSRALKIQGGLTMRLLGPIPRYAVRALENRGIFPTSSPNQGLSGGQFVGIMQKAEEFERGSPADAPAALLPGEVDRAGPAQGGLASAGGSPNAIEPATVPTTSNPLPASLLVMDQDLHDPLYLYIGALLTADDAVSTAPATQPPAATSPPIHLTAIITGVEGNTAEVRFSETSPWQKARIGLPPLHENAQLRTGPKSAIRFVVLPDQTFCLDSQSATSLTTIGDFVAQQRLLKTRIALLHGRLREDLSPVPTTPSRPAAEGKIEEAGLEHDTVIRAPHSALALRGTKVSLFEQEGFDPVAISLTGRAIYTNTHGQSVPFGGTVRTAIRGDQTSAVQQAAMRSTPSQVAYLARTEFEIQEIAIVSQRGGFIKGNVIVGNLHLSDFPRLPGALDFILQWSGGQRQTLNDLNLSVFSPNVVNGTNANDYVANPPFIYSLNPNSPQTLSIEAKLYHQASPSGGRISLNSVGPDGLELASWPGNYPAGTYLVRVYNLLDAKPAPTTTTNPVNYTIDVYLNGRPLIKTFTGSVGLLQTSSPLAVAVPSSTPAGAIARVPSRPKTPTTSDAAHNRPAVAVSPRQNH